jgi:hypothetical protein
LTLTVTAIFRLGYVTSSPPQINRILFYQPTASFGSSYAGTLGTTQIN